MSMDTTSLWRDEIPMGVCNTVHSRVETNEQNAKLGRRLSLIGTAMTNEDFFRAAGEKLLDVHSWGPPPTSYSADA